MPCTRINATAVEITYGGVDGVDGIVVENDLAKLPFNRLIPVSGRDSAAVKDGTAHHRRHSRFDD